jgi:two-component system sensor histidine kinase UhpB
MNKTHFNKHRHTLELSLVVATAVVTFIISSQAEFYERFHALLVRYEMVQADELFVALLGLTVALALFSFMRWRDARRELASRMTAEHQLKRLVARNQELAQTLIGLQEAERRRLAHELHDHFGQCCNAIRIDAVFLRNRLAPLSEERPAADRIAEAADDLYQSVRGLLYELRPASLDSLGLVGAVQSLCESWEERSTINCAWLPHGNLSDLGEDTNIALYRIIQEGLSNVMKHAHASHVRISLSHRADPDTVELVIEDDGRGHDASQVRAGLGWLGMAERASMLGGSLTIGESTLRGVLIRCVFPHPARIGTPPTGAPTAGRTLSP